MILLLLAAQAATPQSPAPAPSEPRSWSILAPVANEPCVPDRERGPDDIVVCGQPLPAQALPYPQEVVLDRPAPSNPELSGTGAMNAEGGIPCGAHVGGCPTGMDVFGAGTALVRLAQKAVAPGSCCEAPGEGTNPALLLKDMVGGVAHAFKKKPDKSNRVAIPLDDAPVSTEGKIGP